MSLRVNGEAVFVSQLPRETPQGWRLRERQRPSLLESSDARADSNRPPGRFRGCCVFVVRAKRREARQPPRPPPAQSPHRKNPSHARARLARARPRSESITSITIPIPHQVAHARARDPAVVRDLSPSFARVMGVTASCRKQKSPTSAKAGVIIVAVCSRL